jgi:hypothetical protein
MDINFLLIIIIISLLNQSILNKRCDKFGGNFFLKDRQGPFTNTGLTCGKSNPKKQEDCTKYGTDSGMYCCWVAKDEDDKDGYCRLISLKKIEKSGIDGCAQFTDSYWSCGNISHNIKINKILLLILIFNYVLLLW